MSTSLQEPGKAKLPSGIAHYHEFDTDIVTWSNKDLPKHIFSFVLWPTFLFSIPVVLTWLLRRDFAKSLLFLALVWLVALFLATLIFRRLFWKETLMISDRNITLSRTGFKEDILRISYERYDPWRGGEIIYSLNIVYRYKLLGSIILWRNKDIPTNWGNLIALIFAVIFAFVIVLYFSYQIFSGVLNNRSIIEQIGILIFYVACWLPLAGALSALQSLTWFEAVRISDTDISMVHSGRHSPQTKQFSKNIVQGIAFLRYKFDGREIIPSLNIF